MEENIIGDRIRQLRRRRGFSQEQFAKALDISTATLSAYENGKTQPPMNVIMKIALMFNTSTDHVLDLMEPDVMPKEWQ